MSIEIPLAGGFVALIDDRDELLVRGLNWRVHSSGRYVQSDCREKTLKRSRIVLLHRLILGITDPKVEVDHINGNGFDNQRSNLRVASHRQNMWNTARQRRSRFEYKGITAGPDGRRAGYCAAISANGERYYLGTFPTQEAAARAYDAAAVRLHGEFARLNFPHPHQRNDVGRGVLKH